MATWTYEVSTEHNYPNITVYKGLRDGVHANWRVNANEGYVFYNSTAIDTEYNPETGEDIPVTYYYTEAILTLNYNFANFPYVAVPRDSVDENYIFGGGGTNHEIM